MEKQINENQKKISNLLKENCLKKEWKSPSITNWELEKNLNFKSVAKIVDGSSRS